MRRAFVVATMIAALGLFGCGNSARRESVGAGSADSSAIPGGAGEGASTPALAPSDTPWVSNRLQQPRARYDSYEIACDSARAIAARALGSYARSAEWTTGAAPFQYRNELVLRPRTTGGMMWTVIDRDTSTLVRGPRMSFESANRQGPSVNHLQDAFAAAGWTNDDWYQADGSDGTSFAMASREALCLVEASWKGDEATDSTYSLPAGIRLRLRVVPRWPGGR